MKKFRLVLLCLLVTVCFVHASLGTEDKTMTMHAYKKASGSNAGSLLVKVSSSQSFGADNVADLSETPLSKPYIEGRMNVFDIEVTTNCANRFHIDFSFTPFEEVSVNSTAPASIIPARYTVAFSNRWINGPGEEEYRWNDANNYHFNTAYSLDGVSYVTDREDYRSIVVDSSAANAGTGFTVWFAIMGQSFKDGSTTKGYFLLPEGLFADYGLDFVKKYRLKTYLEVLSDNAFEAKGASPNQKKYVSWVTVTIGVDT